MYYEVYSSNVTDIATYSFFQDRKEAFTVSMRTVGGTEISMYGDNFSFSVTKSWFEKVVPGQTVRPILDKHKRTVAAVTYMSGNISLLQYGGKQYRIMDLADGTLAFSEKNKLVFCIKQMGSSRGVPPYARERVCGIDGNHYEMMADDNLPLPLSVRSLQPAAGKAAVIKRM